MRGIKHLGEVRCQEIFAAVEEGVLGEATRRAGRKLWSVLLDERRMRGLQLSGAWADSGCRTGTGTAGWAILWYFEAQIAVSAQRGDAEAKENAQ